MRWFAWLVVLCLLAASGARPDAPRPLDRHDATVEDASDLAMQVPRRTSTLSPDKRSDRRVDLAADSSLPDAPPVTRHARPTTFEHRTRTSTIRATAYSSRGPPARLAASSHPSPS